MRHGVQLMIPGAGLRMNEEGIRQHMRAQRKARRRIMREQLEAQLKARIEEYERVKAQLVAADEERAAVDQKRQQLSISALRLEGAMTALRVALDGDPGHAPQ